MEFYIFFVVVEDVSLNFLYLLITVHHNCLVFVYGKIFIYISIQPVKCFKPF